MSHDEIETSHVNTSDLAPIDAIGYALGVALPATVEVIVARVERLLASEKGFQRASERIEELEKIYAQPLSTIAALRADVVRLRKDELAALDKGKAIAAAEYAQCHISIGELAAMLGMEDPSRLGVIKRIAEIMESRDQADDTNALRAELYASKLLADESRADAANLRNDLVEQAKRVSLLHDGLKAANDLVSVIRTGRDKTLAELAEERRFTKRLFAELRGGS